MSIIGTPKDDLLVGGDGHDALLGRQGNDTLVGGEGDDFLYGHAGDDVIDGGAGVDRAAFSSGATGPVTVDLNLQGAAQDTGQGLDVLIGIEHVSGTRFSDRLTGDAGDNWLWGGTDLSGVTGDDTISAGGGNDLVEVGAGNHALEGGAGIDTLSLIGTSGDISPAGVNISLAAQGEAQDTGQGAMTIAGFENISGSIQGDTLGGDAGANLLAGVTGADSLSGGAGDDVLLGDGVMRIDTHDTGGSGPIVTLEEYPYAPGAGDTLDGGAGADVLNGGDGFDRLTGGSGADTFVFAADDALVATRKGSMSVDVITDFSAEDVVDLRGLDANAAVAGDQAFAFVGNGPAKAAAQLSVASYGNIAAAEGALGLELDGAAGRGQSGPVTVVWGNTDADADPEFAIVLLNVRSVTAGDFLL